MTSFNSLAGYPPFSDEIKEYSLHDQIVNARYTFPNEYWDDVSTDGKLLCLTRGRSCSGITISYLSICGKKLHPLGRKLPKKSCNWFTAWYGQLQILKLM